MLLLVDSSHTLLFHKKIKHFTKHSNFNNPISPSIINAFQKQQSLTLHSNLPLPIKTPWSILKTSLPTRPRIFPVSLTPSTKLTLSLTSVLTCLDDAPIEVKVRSMIEVLEQLDRIYFGKDRQKKIREVLDAACA